MSPYEFSEAIGIKKSAYYNKLNGLREWSLPEIVKMSKLTKDDLVIEVNGELYRITIKQK